jgi:hypothetical protein
MKRSDEPIEKEIIQLTIKLPHHQPETESGRAESGITADD